MRTHSKQYTRCSILIRWVRIIACASAIGAPCFCGAAPEEIPAQTVSLSTNAYPPRFVDIDADGRLDLVSLNPLEHNLQIRFQKLDGFHASPDQSIPLPPQTAWASLTDIDQKPGLELLLGTSEGISFFTFTNALFDLHEQSVVQAKQILTNFDFPTLITTPFTNGTGTNISLPIFASDKIVMYERAPSNVWREASTIPIHDHKTTAYAFTTSWRAGDESAHGLRVRRVHGSEVEKPEDEDSEEKAIRKIVDDDLRPDEEGASLSDVTDIDGDGKKDLVLWRTVGNLDFRTDVFIFLRGADKKLPRRPTQVLHCRGGTFPIGLSGYPTPLVDLNGDGVSELILFENKRTFTSVGNLFEMVLSRGIDWVITIRKFGDGMFSRSPDDLVGVTSIIALEANSGWPVRFCPDVNGDKRPDILVRRNETQWLIYPSTAGGTWFEKEPTMLFNVTARGYFNFHDLKGGGVNDAVWHESPGNNLFIFMSPRPATRDNKP